ncbi:transketolase [Clostridium transplantifaecale]|uniref:transketolase n=1 Tax=Clostridium transplantifaecale TaxID=2479838 RepID=UPI001FA95EED|nr:transketolase [Clostridium transplantifaecale]
MEKIDKKELRLFSKRIQMYTMRTIGSLGVGHVGGSLSVADLLAVLYGKAMKYDSNRPDWEERDWLVCSKGHAGPAVYSALALKGFFPESELQTLNRPGTRLPSHCDRNLTTGIDMTTGSLGQGASTAAGVAFGMKLDGKNNFVYLILGDGEIQEGQVWEMALFASQRKLSNLIAFVDYNHIQLDGYTDDICSLGDVKAKFEAFGWYAQDVDGHDVEAIDRAVCNAKAQNEKPSMIVLETEKGHGWSEIAGKLNGHCPTVSEEQLKAALEEMRQAYGKIEEETL